MGADYKVVGWDGRGKYLVFSPPTPEGLAYVYDAPADIWHAPVPVTSFMAQLHNWRDAVSVPDSLLETVEYNLNPAETVTKGDTVGHPFHGNQYTDVASAGEFPRPPVGKLQFSAGEIEGLSKFYDQVLAEGKSPLQAGDALNVHISKLLGYDKPAKITSEELPFEDEEGVVWRGCDQAGIDALTQPLHSYGGGNRAILGAGAYFSEEINMAFPYAQDWGNLVQAQISPDAHVFRNEYYPDEKGNTELAFPSPIPDEVKSQLSDSAKSFANDVLAVGGTLALLNGYQAFSSDGILVVFDRSILSINPFAVEDGEIVEKGDVPGHLFHGNQYVTAEGVADTSRTLQRFLSDKTLTHGDMRSIARIHKGIAEQHRRIVKQIAPTAQDAMDLPPEATAELLDHTNAAIAHDRAGDAWSKASARTEKSALQQNLRELPNSNELHNLDTGEILTPRQALRILGENKNAVEAVQAAREASQEAINSSVKFGGGEIAKGDLLGHLFRGNQYMTAEEHTAEADSAGRKAAYHEREAARLEADGDNTQAIVHAAKGVALRQVEARHRKLANGEIQKGDVAGHPFRGNQWTDGIGGEKVAEIQSRLAETAKQLNEEAFTGYAASPERLERRLDNLKAAGYNSLEEYQKASAQAIKDFVAKNDIVVSIVTPERNLVDILNSGEIQNGYVSGKSERGYADQLGTPSDSRMKMENKAFGLTEKSPLSERPVYGFVDSPGPADDPLDYGNAKIVLNPDVKERSTVTLGDSLDISRAAWDAPFADTAAPLLASNPNPSDIFYPSQGVIPTSLTSTENISRDFGYVEAQIHGGLKTSDIARVEFYDKPKPEVAEALDAKGIPYKVIGYLGIVKGDFLGHPFRGNQYDDGTGGGTGTKTRTPRVRAELPTGWKVESKTGGRVVLKSDGGNTAIFSTKGSWKFDDPMSHHFLNAIDSHSSGKTLNFAPKNIVAGARTLAFVNFRSDNDVIEIMPKPRIDATLEKLATTFGSDSEITSLSDSLPKTQEMLSTYWATYNAYSNPEKVIEAVVCHELGHSDFANHSAEDIYEAVASVLPVSTDELRAAERAGYDKVIPANMQTNIRINAGDTNTVNRPEALDYMVANWCGTAPLTDAPAIQSALSRAGITHYGATNLQETVAEARACFEMPELPKTPLVMALADKLGWQVKKAVGEMRQEGPRSLANIGIADGLDGPMLIVDGMMYNYQTGEWSPAYVTEEEAEAEIQKGDLPGHPFRGNQYTGGQGVALSDLGQSVMAAETETPPSPPAFVNFKPLTSTEIVEHLGDKLALGGDQNNGFSKVRLADGSLGLVKYGVGPQEADAEILSCQIAKALDLPTIESVILKEYAGSCNLLMPFVESTMPTENVLKFNIDMDSRGDEPLQGYDVQCTSDDPVIQRDFQAAHLLHAITGNGDDHPGNWIVKQDSAGLNRLVAIDNALAFFAPEPYEIQNAAEMYGMPTDEIVSRLETLYSSGVLSPSQRDLFAKGLIPTLLALKDGSGD